MPNRTPSAATLRRLNKRTLTETATVYNQGTDDGRGGTTEPQVVYEDVPCRKQPISVQDATEYFGGSLQGTQPVMIVFDVEVETEWGEVEPLEIKHGWTIEIDGARYQVRSVVPPGTNGHAYRTAAEKV